MLFLCRPVRWVVLQETYTVSEVSTKDVLRVDWDMGPLHFRFGYYVVVFLFLCCVVFWLQVLQVPGCREALPRMFTHRLDSMMLHGNYVCIFTYIHTHTHRDVCVCVV